MNQPSMNASPYPQQGEVIDGKYQIDRLLGEGGMGAVAKATHLLRRAPVALKFMSPHVMGVTGAVERFLNEGVAASQIDSEYVVKVFDVGRLPNGAPYLVMECLDGQDLSDLLQREGTPGLPIERAIHFMLQALRGLQVAHDVGIVHRDMKPSNCFVIQRDGEPDFVKLLDFGISKVQQPGGGSLTQTNSALGTPLYMSPEQAKSARNVDLRSDLYSASVILYELLTGRTPFNSESGEFTEILFKIFTTDPPPIKEFRPDLPDGLAAAIHKGLAREASDRYVDAADFCESLVPYADERSRQVVMRIRHRAANQGRPTNVPLSELGSQVNQSRVVVPATGVGAPRAMTAAEAMASTRYSGASLEDEANAARTNLEATKDATSSGKRTPVLAVAAAVFVLLGLGGGLAVYRASQSTAKANVGHDTTTTTPTGANANAGPPKTPDTAGDPPPNNGFTLTPVASAAPPPQMPSSLPLTSKPSGPTTAAAVPSSEPKKPKLKAITIQE